MKVLIGCEESQTVCIEFRKLGHEAYSCDLQECSGGHPEWHLQLDIFTAINGGWLMLQNENKIYIDKWHMMIAFPPCTHLAVSGAAWFEQKRKDGRQQQGIDFFMAIVNAPIEKIAIENPIGIMSKIYRKPNQIIQPYFFGDCFQKSTCLWLKNLPELKHRKEDHVDRGEMIEYKSGKRMSEWYANTYKLSKGERAKMRSKTFPGIAKAMAMQWG